MVVAGGDRLAGELADLLAELDADSDQAADPSLAR
jgi:hypothetical protein